MVQPYVSLHADGPEKGIQEAVLALLNSRGWFTMETYGNAFQKGFPDIWASHKQFRNRWIECKNPKKYTLTAAQRECFPKLADHGAPVWILVAATEEEYAKLWQPPNWKAFW